MPRRTRTTHIVVHCSATPPQRDIGRDIIREWHLSQGWVDIGYAMVIRRNGLYEFGRHFDDIGAHVAGWNGTTVGICLVGGLYPDGSEAVDDFEHLFTIEQRNALRVALQFLLAAYPDALVVGHRDLSPDKNKDGKITQSEWLKSCPGFDVKEWCRRNGL